MFNMYKAGGPRADRRLTFASKTFWGPSGGIGRVSELSARVAIDEGYPVSLLSLDDKGGDFQNRPFWRGHSDSRVRFVADCVRASLSGDQMFYDQLGIARAHILPDKLVPRCAVWIYGIEVWDQLRPDRLRIAKDRVDTMIAITHFTRQRAITYDKVFESARVCWISTSEDEPPENPASLDGPPEALIIGRLDNSAYKGHKELIEAWPSVLEAVPEARLTIVGTGPTMELHRAMAQESSAAKYIDVLGFVPEADIPDLWRRATLFAMPSRGEGFGLTYIEAMRWGIPVIASVHDAGQEVNVHGETGLNVSLDFSDGSAGRVSGAFARSKFGAEHGRERSTALARAFLL